MIRGHFIPMIWGHPKAMLTETHPGALFHLAGWEGSRIRPLRQTLYSSNRRTTTPVYRAGPYKSSGG